MPVVTGGVGGVIDSRPDHSSPDSSNSSPTFVTECKGQS